MKLSVLPAVFLARMMRIIPEDFYSSFVASFFEDKMTSFRVNTLKAPSRILLNQLLDYGLNPSPINWCPDSFYVSKKQRETLTKSQEAKDGLIYIQNPSSMFASLVLDPQPGEHILDLAAAPGGKSLHIAVLMANQGRIAAVERVKERFFRLKANVKRSGASIIHCYCKDGAKIGRLVPERFDRVLLDAPCSSEGGFDLTDNTSFAYWSEKKIKEMTFKQKQLIYSAILSLKPNGTLVYSTCTYAPEENEAIVDYALKKFHQKIEIVPIHVPFTNKQSGLTAWQEQNFSPSLINAVRILPTNLMNGFFICKMKKILENVS
jgi:NOL1/NOP2/sun family putative RNA methylase